MIRPIVFSNGTDLGARGDVDALIVTLAFETGRFDLLAVVRRAGRVQVRHFNFEEQDQHATRCVQWVQEVTGLSESDVLRCADFGRELAPGAEVRLPTYGARELERHSRARTARHVGNAALRRRG